MAYSLNRVQLIGNLTRDPEIRQIPAGKMVATFSVATNYSWSDINGQKQEKTEFHNLVAWGKLADICGQYLKKGMKVFVEGRLQTRDWEGEDGVKRYKTEIVLDNMIMLSAKGNGGDFVNEFRGGIKQQSSKIKDDSGIDNLVGVGNMDEEVTLEDLPF